MSVVLEAPRFGPDDKPVAELTDAELLEELRARRIRRGATTAGLPNGGQALDRQRIAQHLANLELRADADLAEVERAHARLRAKYEPYLDSEDPRRGQAARTLLDALDHAYQELQALLPH